MVKRSIFVGSGTGPLTVAPVRLAVSTISRAELSIRRWSNAFKRMRMFWFAMAWSLSCKARCAGKSSRAASLLEDLGYDAGADGLATLADRKPQPLLHRNRTDQLD